MPNVFLIYLPVKKGMHNVTYPVRYMVNVKWRDKKLLFLLVLIFLLMFLKTCFNRLQGRLASDNSTYSTFRTGIGLGFAFLKLKILKLASKCAGLYVFATLFKCNKHLIHVSQGPRSHYSVITYCTALYYSASPLPTPRRVKVACYT
jgi:hypothetical protein